MDSRFQLPPSPIEQLNGDQEESYLCPLCLYSTTSAAILFRHLFIHTGVKPYCCFECGERFAIPETLRSHLAVKHPRKLPLHCDRCRSSFRFRLELCQHEVLSSLETLHYCYYCGKGFLSAVDVLQHARTLHLPSRKHECDVCGRFFPSFESISIHSVFHLRHSSTEHLLPPFAGFRKGTKFHLRRRPHRCPSCPKHFLHLRSLKRHQQSHRREGSVACRVCDRPFTLPCSVLNHAREHEEELRLCSEEPLHALGLLPTDPPHECELCGKTYSTSNSLRAHRKTHSSDRPHKCDVCQKQFLRSYDLKRHLRIHTGERPFVCDVCGQGFFQSSAMRNHLRTHTGERPFSCEVCGKDFTLASTLRGHMKIHTGERPHRCTLCAKSFSRPYELKTHMRIHTGERPFACGTCGLGFAQASTLRTHVKIHEQGTASFACRLCGEAFDRATDLELHSKVHTGELSPQESAQQLPFRCSICSKTFTRQTHLRNHMKLHLGPEPFKCEVCGQAFAQFSSLKSHLKAHMGEPSYSCSACGQHFLQFSALKAHMVLHTSEKAVVAVGE
ncbi:hypothetical protein HPB47_019862 [Ixodes persulcatus]|uniref:Uncharacterized protein n=1 Tax=Ixodes persulcatus TaxID=34615 RepID=A0AC60QKJ0_IXOPE|nr:gastrula zinc finger protein XlCGF26.1 [Ixodes scapularis]XP_029827978.1 gastrula zinc finger protein XlCGF26.1 [Ixodes scapularis]KAG0433498.1 hypothetical protein HPB47_019862 [Ixodes persulcatus]